MGINLKIFVFTKPLAGNQSTASTTGTPIGNAASTATPTPNQPGSQQSPAAATSTSQATTTTTTGATTTAATPLSNPVLDNLRPTMQIAADYLREYLHPLTDYTSLDLGVMQHLSYITQLYPTILNEKFSDYLLSHLRRWLDDVLKIMKENSDAINAAASAAAQAAAAAAASGAIPPPPPPNVQGKSYQNEVKLCSAIISLLSELQSAPAKLVDVAISTIIKYEKAFSLEVSGVFRQPLCALLKRYPIDTLRYLIHQDRIKEPYHYRFILYLFRKHSDAFGKIFKVYS